MDEKRVGDEYLTPYSNDYNEWVQYQTYDVTEEVSKQGMLRVLLGNGWYKARFGFSAFEDKGVYGNEWKLIAELHLTYADGSEEVIGTDESWQVRRSKIAFSNLYDGEHRDDTLSELPLEKAVFCEAPKGELTERMSLPVTIHETFEPKELLHTPAGELVFDMGQEFTGIFKLHVNVPAGTKVHVQTCEILQRGNFYNDNLRSAKSEYIYISDGTEMDLVPHFTFYGYRYVKIEGIPDLKKEDFTGLSYYSNITATGWMKTGSDLVNQLISNVRWGLKCNFVDVPTDCPQRNERMGWAGDTHIFCHTALNNSSLKKFYERNLQAMRDLQTPEGQYPEIAPVGGGFGGITYECASIFMAWELYEQYGDIRTLEKFYPGMQKYMDYMKDKGLPGTKVNPAIGPLGDWLAPEETDLLLLWNAFYYKEADLMSRIAGALGRTEEQHQYEALAAKVKKFWNETYVLPDSGKTCNADGTLCDTQCSSAIALSYGVAEDRK